MNNQKRILLIDDCPMTRLRTQSALECCGYGVLVAEDGNWGLQTARRTEPDSIIVHMMMHKVGGFQVVKQLKHGGQGLQSIPVIMLMDSEIPRHQEYAQQLGVRDCLPLPVSLAQLTRCVECTLNLAMAHRKDY